MNDLSRREFVFLSSGAVAGNMVVPGLSDARDNGKRGLDFSRSGLVTGRPKPLKHTSIPGFLSAEQIAPHQAAHYGGALKGYLAADFIASAKAAAGWAMLARHSVNDELYNVVSDEHPMNVVWMAIPLVVTDTYEHAFYIDYQNRKADYVEKFVDHIDWAEVNVRFRVHG